MLLGVCSLSADLAPAQAQTHPTISVKIFSTAPIWVGPLPTFRSFTHEVRNGQADQIVGLYAPGLMALSIETQPLESPFSVTDDAGRATLFAAALRNGTVGLLAHSHLAGAYFTYLELNQSLILIYGDGRSVHYHVSHIEAYRALEPNNPYSAFLALHRDNQLSSQALFDHIYASGPALVLQTCLEEEGQPNWGRLFIIASSSNGLAMKSLAATIADNMK
jgi:hypothetical protein